MEEVSEQSEEVDLQPNDVIGSYRVIRKLGQGGMGAVYEVEHEKLGVRYALKTFTLDSGESVELFRRRFLAEGKILARLSHPNIARVFDLDYDEASGFAYFIMDLIHYKDGDSYTLADIENGGADEEHLSRWFAQLASALDYIHGEGIIHRDIKLNNVLLNDKGGVILSDFGISRFVDERIRREINVTRTIISRGTKQVTGNFIVGTEGYMSPEILRGEEATASSDTYALGITFFRLLTGIWYESGTDVLRLLEPFDSAWMEILPQMLDANPKKRPTKLMPLAEKLTSSVAAAAISVGTGKKSSEIRTKRVSRNRPSSRPRHRLMPWLLGGFGLVAAGLVAVLAFVWHASGSSESEVAYDQLSAIPECLQ